MASKVAATRSSARVHPLSARCPALLADRCVAMGTQLEPECVLDSDEEPCLAAGALSRYVRVAEEEEEAVLSDGEPAWVAPAQWAEPEPAALRQLNALLPPSTQQQQLAAQGSKAFSRSLASKPAFSRASSSTSSASRASSFRRPMKTAAAADADRAAAERAATQAAELSGALEAVGNDPSGVTQLRDAGTGLLEQQPCRSAAAAAGRAPGGASASFLNRRVLPRVPSRVEELRQKLQGCPAAVAAAAAGDEEGDADDELEPATASAAEPRPAAPRQPPRQQQQQHQQWRPPPLPALACATFTVCPAEAAMPEPGLAHPPAAAAPAATFHRTADGLNVVRLNRQTHSNAAEAAGGSGSGKAKGRTDNVNSGWGNNFVRIDLKVGAACILWRATSWGPELRCKMQTAVARCPAKSVRLPASPPAHLQKGRGSTKFGTKYGTKYGGKKRHGGRGGRGGSRWQGECCCGLARCLAAAWGLPAGRPALRLEAPPMRAIHVAMPPPTCPSPPLRHAAAAVQCHACARWAMAPTIWRAGRAAACAATSAAAPVTLPRTAPRSSRRRQTRGLCAAPAAARRGRRAASAAAPQGPRAMQQQLFLRGSPGCMARQAARRVQQQQPPPPRPPAPPPTASGWLQRPACRRRLQTLRGSTPRYWRMPARRR